KGCCITSVFAYNSRANDTGEAMDRKQKILELARQMGLIRPRDVEAAGISSQIQAGGCVWGLRYRCRRSFGVLHACLEATWGEKPFGMFCPPNGPWGQLIID
ncbi:MAG: hypothetical protein KAI86_04520, partial [Desulfobacterales bacterium]|nr:hypothetical protein [Desulfobacterales bacterium]